MPDSSHLVEQKRSLREHFIQKRDLLSKFEREDRSSKCLAQIKSFEPFQNAKSIHVFASFGQELNTLPLIDFMLSQAVEVFLPKVQKNRLLSHHPLHHRDELKVSSFGILEPCSIPVVREEYDIIFVPGLAFDKKGFRIGYGGGYYDQFLAEIRGLKVGLAYAFQKTEECPCEDHDQKLDFLITDEGIEDFREA